MKQRNLALQAAVAAAFGLAGAGAHAGSLLTTTKSFATQIFGATAPATTEVVPGPVTFSVSSTNGINISPTGSVYLYYRVSNGAVFTAAPLAAHFTGPAGPGGALGLTITAAGVTLSTDGTSFAVQLYNGTAGNVVIGVGPAVIWTPVATYAVQKVNTVLATAGGTIGLTTSISAVAGGVNNATLPAELDGGISNSVNVALAASAINATVTAPAAAAESAKIDVTATPTQTVFTTGAPRAGDGSITKLYLGSFKFTDVAGVFQKDGATAYSVANNGGATGVGAVVTGNFAAVTAGGLILTSDLASTALAAGSVGILNAGKTTATFTGGTKQASGAPIYVQMNVDGAVIPVMTPTMTTSLTPTVGTEAVVTGSGTLYPLALNGASVDIRTYIPSGVSGYASYIRVINTGTSTAPVSVAVIDPGTGVAGTSSVLISSLPAGAATTLTAAQIEAVTGPIAAATRPRLRFSGPTSALQIQSFGTNPDGTFSDLTGAQ